MPNFFHFNNQQSSLDNHQSDEENAVLWLTQTGISCAALRAFKGVGGGPQSGGFRTPAEIGVGKPHWFAAPLPPNRTGGSPASGSPVDRY